MSAGPVHFAAAFWSEDARECPACGRHLTHDSVVSAVVTEAGDVIPFHHGCLEWVGRLLRAMDRSYEVHWWAPTGGA